LPPSSLLDAFADDLVLAPPPPAADTPDPVTAPAEVSLLDAPSVAPLDTTEQSGETKPPSVTLEGETQEPVFLFASTTTAGPQIVNFTAIEVVGGLWRFTGDVIAEAPGGLTVSFGGEPISLQGVTTTTDDKGHFDKAVLLNTDGSDNGLASAQTVDSNGLASNVALYNVSPR
jgi:hypothetical protein